MGFSLPVRDHVDRDGVQECIYTLVSVGDRGLVARATVVLILLDQTAGPEGGARATAPRVTGQGKQGVARETRPGCVCMRRSLLALRNKEKGEVHRGSCDMAGRGEGRAAFRMREPG